jgi:hypothetical protein
MSNGITVDRTNGTEPPSRAVDTRNQGGIIESDNDITDAADPCSATGHIETALFPATRPDLAAQQAASVARAEKSPAGDDATAQNYTATVPFSDTTLKLGSSSSAGGNGASLTTGGNAFVGAAGALGMQSVGAFTGQTKAAMGLYSGGGTFAHSQSRFEIYAGGGTAPGDCGSGGPAGDGGTTKPAEGAEMVTNAICNTLGVVKGVNDVVNAVKGMKAPTDLVSGIKVVSDVASIAKGTTDAAGKGYAVVAGVTASTKDEKDAAKANTKAIDTTSGVINSTSGAISLVSSVASLAKGNPGDAFSSLLSGVSSLASGVGSVSGAQGGTGILNTDGPVPKSTGAAGSVPKKAGAPEGAGGGGGGGGGAALDIEERAADNINMVANLKISGNAPEGIDWKVGGMFIVNAISNVDFATTNWGAFAAYAFKVRAGAVIDVKCRKFEMKAWSKGTVKTPHTTVTAATMSTLDGKTRVTGTLTVVQLTHLKNDLHVKGNADFNMNVIIKQTGEYRKNAKGQDNVVFGQNLKVNGKHRGKGKLKVLNQAKLG